MICQKGPSCKYLPNCKFIHLNQPAAKINQPKPPNTNTLCKFGDKCFKQMNGCPFSHPVKEDNPEIQPPAINNPLFVGQNQVKEKKTIFEKA
jgi:hypothetical protein